MNYKKFFDKAKDYDLDSLELHIHKTTKLSFSLFKNEIDSYSIADSYQIAAKGIYKGTMGYANSEKLDKTTPDFICSKIRENAMVITSDDKRFIYEGSPKYKKGNVYSKKLAEAETNSKIALAKELDRKVKELDPRITEVETQYEEVVEELTLLNSYGLKLSQKSNYAYIFSSAVANDEAGDTKNGYAIKLFNDLDEINVDELAREVVRKTISQFGSAPCKSGKYKCIFDSKTFSSFLSFFLDNLSSEEVQKGTSLLKDKLNQQVTSTKLTITEEPLKKNVFFRYFDDEGVATYNKTLIKKGILQTYTYNLKTAAKDNVASTGNGYRGISLNNVCVKGGKITEAQLIEKVGNGVYINNVQGLHSGMNPQSGNFSLQAQGFMIRDGKLAEPLSLITVAGNLFDIFMNIKELASNNELQTNSYDVPSVFIKAIQVSGK